MEKTPKTAISITLDHEVKEGIRALAKENYRSLSRQINLILKQYLARTEK